VGRQAISAKHWNACAHSRFAFRQIDNQAPVTQVATCGSAKIIAVVRRRWQPWSEW